MKKITKCILIFSLATLTLCSCTSKEPKIENDKNIKESTETTELPKIEKEEMRDDYLTDETENNEKVSLEIINKNNEITNNEKEYKGTQYYYDKLSEREQKIYVKYKEAVENLDTEIIIPKMTEEEAYGKFFERIYTFVGCDNPQLFVQPEYFGIEKTDNEDEVKLILQYDSYWTKASYDIAKQELNDALKGVYNKLDNINGDYNKVQWLYNYLTRTITYDLTPPWTTGMYGALVKKNCSCEGISEAFEYILNIYGIEAMSVTGQAGFMSDSLGPHKWSIVKLDNKWYHFDVTWDLGYDLNKFLPFYYFAVPEQDIRIAHFLDHPELLPTANSRDFNYHTYNDLLLKTSDNNSIAAAAVRSYKLTPGYISIKFSNTNDFNNACNNVETWLQKAFDVLSITKWNYEIMCNEELQIISIGIPK